MATDPNDNPLLNHSELAYLAVPFDRIQPAHFLPALESAIQEAKKKIEKIKGPAGKPTFENTIETLEVCSERIDWIAGIFFNLLSAHTNDEMQSIAEEFAPRLSGFSSDLSLDPDLFAKVKSVYEQRLQLQLTTEQSQLLENTYLDFVRNGALLNESDKTRLRELDQQLARLGPKFSDNVLKSTNEFEMYLSKPEEISGLPESALEAARAAAAAKNRPGEYLFTLQMPSYLPFIKYADHRPSRERMTKAQGMVAFGGAFDNQPLVSEIVSLRIQRANLLGYKNHAEFVLQKRMAETPERVLAFMERLYSASKPAALRDLNELKTFAKSLGGPDELMPWDILYYSEKLKEARYKLNEEELRPYFKLENVIQGAFELASRLFKLEFKPSTAYPTYHPDVQTFEVYKNNGGKSEFYGLFYADFFPRAEKRSGAWQTNYLSQGLFAGSVVRPHASIVCNFTKPTPTKPSLLTHDEVQTLFHEFGHALHSLLSKCHYRSLAGTNVYWDFVELPSQVLENWTKEKASLDLFARHYQTNQPIPEELAKKIKDSSKFMAGYTSLRQLSLGYLDMAWHTLEKPTSRNVADFEDQAMAKTRILPKVPGTNTSASFNHIFAGGYSAGYYSYKWAEVLDADAFEFFLQKGLFDTEVARRFEENILSRGGSEHPMELYKRFRGREPDPDALLRREGLLGG